MYGMTNVARAECVAYREGREHEDFFCQYDNATALERLEMQQRRAFR